MTRLKKARGWVKKKALDIALALGILGIAGAAFIGPVGGPAPCGTVTTIKVLNTTTSKMEDKDVSSEPCPPTQEELDAAEAEQAKDVSISQKAMRYDACRFQLTRQKQEVLYSKYDTVESKHDTSNKDGLEAKYDELLAECQK